MDWQRGQDRELRELSKKIKKDHQSTSFTPLKTLSENLESHWHVYNQPLTSGHAEILRWAGGLVAVRWCCTGGRDMAQCAIWGSGDGMWGWAGCHNWAIGPQQLLGAH